VAVLFATLIATRFINRKPFAAVGLAVNRHTARELGIGCLAGWLMMTGIFGVEYLLGYMKVVSTELSAAQAFQAFGVSLVFFAVAAMVEEVLFRGYLFQTLARGIKFIPATLVVGLLFGLAHVRNPNASTLGVVNTVLVAILFCLAYWRTRSLWLPFGIHFAWNFSQTTLYGFPTSGMDFSRYELTKLTQFGDEWITGGAYGPEGGALATVAILLCGAYIFFSRTLLAHQDLVTLEREGEKLTVPFLDRYPSAEVRRIAA
jgi:membrane protease YdiL (CAAX protease family)